MCIYDIGKSSIKGMLRKEMMGNRILRWFYAVIILLTIFFVGQVLEQVVSVERNQIIKLGAQP